MIKTSGLEAILNFCERFFNQVTDVIFNYIFQRKILGKNFNVFSTFHILFRRKGSWIENSNFNSARRAAVNLSNSAFSCFYKFISNSMLIGRCWTRFKFLNRHHICWFLDPTLVKARENAAVLIINTCCSYQIIIVGPRWELMMPNC